jgi:hypothetical protein
VTEEYSKDIPSNPMCALVGGGEFGNVGCNGDERIVDADVAAVL